MVRLYIGGIPPGITAEELAQRFVSFGAVAACEIAPAKEYSKLHACSPPELYPRNFGFVTLEPKDDQSLRRALQVYNGCKWRGAVMRCYVAKDSGVERVAKEIAEEMQLKLEVSGGWRRSGPLAFRRRARRELTAAPTAAAAAAAAGAT
jgi:hypothetical protein